MLASVEIPWLFTEYEFDEFRRVIRNAMLHLRNPLSLTAENTDILLVWPMDRIAIKALSQEMASYSGQQISAKAVWRRFELHELSARRTWLQLPLTLHHRRKCFQMYVQRRIYTSRGTSYFQTNLDSIYSIMMVTPVFDGIVANTRCQHVFNIVILTTDPSEG